MIEDKNNISINDFYIFIDSCSSFEDDLLHIKDSDSAERMALICNKFQDTVLIQFTFNTEFRNDDFAHDLYLTLGVTVIFPGNVPKTYQRYADLIFKDIFELSYNYKNVNRYKTIKNPIEIEIDNFEVSSDNICFSFHSINDKSKLFSIKAKELLVNNFIYPKENPEENNNDEVEDEYDEDINIASLSLIDKARYLLNKEKYPKCIQLLKYDYFDLEKDAEANCLLATCFVNIGKRNDAISYIDKAIALDKTNSEFFYLKSVCLETNDLSMEYINTIKTAIDLAVKEDDALKYSQALIDYVTTRLENYTLKILENNDIFNLYIRVFDAIIYLKYALPEIITKYKKLKNDAINYYYTKTYNILNSPHTAGKSFKALASRCNTLLKIQDLSFEQQTAIKNLLKSCNELVQKFETKKSTFTSPSYFNSWDKIHLIEDMMSSGMSKSEMIEQLSAEFGMSEESAKASLNSYYRNDDLDLRGYFNNVDDNDDEDDDSSIDNEDDYDDESWA